MLALDYAALFQLVGSVVICLLGLSALIFLIGCLLTWIIDVWVKHYGLFWNFVYYVHERRYKKTKKLLATKPPAKRHSIKLGKWKHYKGTVYNVLGVVNHTETGEQMVRYCLYEPASANDAEVEWVR